MGAGKLLVRVRAFFVLGVLAALFATFAAATPARAADTQAAYLADRLRENPVYVSDQLPREVPKSMTPDFAEVAKRTGVPTYVIVLPSGAVNDDGLLGAVHDRLGKDGLFVIVDDSSVSYAEAFGVRAPADDALTICLYELPYDAHPLDEFELFAEVIAQGPEKAAQRADAARDKGADDEPDEMYVGPSDRENQSILTGVLATAVPAVILLLFPAVRRWRRKLKGGTPKKAKKGKKKGGRAGRPRRWMVPTATALLACAAVLLTANAAFDQTRSSAAPRPRAMELNARLDRVAEGLAEDPVYTDPESPRILDGAQLARLHSRIEKFERSEGGGPVFVAVVPQISEDESEGDEENFAYALHDKVGQDGVYIVADPLYGGIDAFNHGLRLDSLDLLLDLPEFITYGDDKSRDAEDHLLGERLDALMTHLDEAPRTDAPDNPGDPYPVTNPVTEDDLPPLFGDDFQGGLFLGLLVAGLAYGLLEALAAIAIVLLRRRGKAPLLTSALPASSPTKPTASYLRRTARTELRALKADFESAPPSSDPRPGDCLDAALLLLEGDPARIDHPDTDSAALVAVIVLSRAGRAALDRKGYNRCCAVNPLHGPAVTRHQVRLSAERKARRHVHICGACREKATSEASTMPTHVLALPDPPVRYLEAEPLDAVPDGIRRLIEKVREMAHVA
ncbi:hypothetical protein GA0115233_1003107 [Streptomyces sp. DI166]|uniref:hypothetical protein n=1 Tax=Streptomyces sp. DI166 TaxID=1839783 RepID=UPI0007F466F3|nr:hypothetical protein [Streptomyces sp. DI166]SBT88585.1 hypothetical protein GA0115233_1003107 [Streptomyces sp. DI166]